MRRLLARLAGRAGSHAYRVLGRRLTSHAVAPLGDVDLRVMRSEEVLAQCAEPALELPAAKAQAALARGEIAVGALDRGNVVAYAWFAFEPAPHVDGVWTDFDRSAVYIYRAFVRPEYRGRRIAPALYRFADALCLGRGRTIALLCIEMHNRPSLSAAQRSGARELGFTAYAHIGDRLLSIRGPGARRVGYRFYLPNRRAPS